MDILFIICKCYVVCKMFCILYVILLNKVYKLYVLFRNLFLLGSDGEN